MKKFSNLIRFVFLGMFLVILTGGNVQSWFKVYVATLILAIFFGRFYCGYICPMNTLMIYTEKLSRKMGFQKEKIPAIFKWKYMSAFVFFTTIIVVILVKNIFQKDIPIILVFLVFSLVSTIFFKQELFHNQFCPFGFLQRFFAKKSIYSHKVIKNECIGCKLCEKKCPTGAIKVMDNKKAVINKSFCLQCSNCIDVCPKEAIKYSK